MQKVVGVGGWYWKRTNLLFLQYYFSEISLDDLENIRVPDSAWGLKTCLKSKQTNEFISAYADRVKRDGLEDEIRLQNMQVRAGQEKLILGRNMLKNPHPIFKNLGKWQFFRRNLIISPISVDKT